jgi:phage baseplate assembly protein W
MTVSVALPSTVGPIGSSVAVTSPVMTFSPITADYIDPATGDYASMTSGLHPIDAQVILAMSTVKGSGTAVMDLGCNLEKIRKIRDTVKREIESEVRVALKRLIDNGDIRLGTFTYDVQSNNQYVGMVVNYVNLRASGRRSVALVITN